MKHVHAELMMLYAQDAMETDKPWERWQFRKHEARPWCDYESTHPEWIDSFQYRRKPRTIKVNGFDVPEPMREAPEKETWFWVSDSTTTKFFSEGKWIGNSFDKMLLSRGLIHSTIEAAAKHAMAMCGIDPATYKPE